MKMLIISDTHFQEFGRDEFDQINQILQRAPDVLVHLGDFVHPDLYYYLKSYPFDFYAVAGNCDPCELQHQLPSQYLLQWENTRFLLTHGSAFIRQKHVNQFLHYERNNIDFLLFGHWHTPFIETIEGINVVNPGSLSYNRNHAPIGFVEICWKDNHWHTEFLEISREIQYGRHAQRTNG